MFAIRTQGVALSPTTTRVFTDHGVALKGVAPNAEGNPNAAASVASFVALLDVAPDGRVPAAELADAYVALAGARGWPTLDRTAFGKLVRAEIKARGGSKLKSSGQQVYVGIRLPTVMAVASLKRPP